MNSLSLSLSLYIKVIYSNLADFKEVCFINFSETEMFPFHYFSYVSKVMIKVVKSKLYRINKVVY